MEMPHSSSIGEPGVLRTPPIEEDSEFMAGNAQNSIDPTTLHNIMHQKHNLRSRRIKLAVELPHFVLAKPKDQKKSDESRKDSLLILDSSDSKIVSLNAKLRKSPDNYEALLSRAESFFGAGMLALAWEDVQELRILYPGDYAVNVLRRMVKREMAMAYLGYSK